MPFTIDGQWVPSKEISNKPSTNKNSGKPVKIYLIKRGKSTLTLISNLKMATNELETLASALKRTLGCGGTTNNQEIEIQGDKVDQVRKALKEMGIILK